MDWTGRGGRTRKKKEGARSQDTRHATGCGRRGREGGGVRERRNGIKQPMRTGHHTQEALLTDEWIKWTYTGTFTEEETI
jgi:hypothetical protein